MAGYISRHILTYTGRLVDPFDLHKEDIDIVDIAHALSNVCRYAGHTKVFYSVAQHSLYVSELVEEHHSLLDFDDEAVVHTALQGLLHDATEAYMQDIVGPLKHEPEFDVYRQREHAAEKIIMFAFGLAEMMPEIIKEYDTAMLRTEQRDLMVWHNEHLGQQLKDTTIPLISYPPEQIERTFLERYYHLNGRLNHKPKASQTAS